VTSVVRPVWLRLSTKPDVILLQLPGRIISDVLAKRGLDVVAGDGGSRQVAEINAALTGYLEGVLAILGHETAACLEVTSLVLIAQRSREWRWRVALERRALRARFHDGLTLPAVLTRLVRTIHLYNDKYHVFLSEQMKMMMTMMMMISTIPRTCRRSHEDCPHTSHLYNTMQT